VFLPSPEELLPGPFFDTEAEGAIVGFSDSGFKLHAFAIVELDNKQTMVVPVEKLKGTKGRRKYNHSVAVVMTTLPRVDDSVEFPSR